MRTTLLTAYNTAYEPLAELTVPLMSAYAKKHGYEFNYVTAHPPGDGVYWTKFIAALEHLRDTDETDRFIWLDCDIMITNPDFSLGKYLANFGHGFHVPKDWGFDAEAPSCVSACAVIVHKDCIEMLEEILSLEPDSRGQPFPEQIPMRQVLRKHMMDGGPVYWHAAKPLNAVPNEVCPGKVVDPWKPGDFAAHLTMLPVRERIELFHEIKKQI